MEKFSYGKNKDQYINIYSEGDGPWVLLIHGGYWKQRYNEDLNNLMILQFLKSNFKVLSIEYRRERNKWPIPLKDVEKGIKMFKESNIFKGEDIIFVGHSVGGQISLMLHEYSDFTILLAPVTDIEYTYKNNLGEGIVSTYFSTLSNKIVKQASPFNLIHLGDSPILIIHGKNDKDVHYKNSENFYNKFSEKKENIFLMGVETLDHMECINNKKLLNQISKIILNYTTLKKNEKYNIKQKKQK